VQAVLKKALAYDGLARGLHEAARAIERDEAKVGPCCLLPSSTAPVNSGCSIHAAVLPKAHPRWV